MTREELRQKLPAWRQQERSWRDHLLRAYYGARPGRRWRILRQLARGRLGALSERIQKAEETLASPERSAEAAA